MVVRQTLTRGCGSCIKARRKCTRALPQCQRCEDKSIKCIYKNTPLVSIGDLAHSVSRTSAARRVLVKQHLRFPTTESISIDWKPLKSPEVILTFDAPTLEYLKDHLQSFPGTFVRTGGTLFIHLHLYQNGLPPTLRRMLELCILFTEPKPRDARILEQAISHSCQAFSLSTTSLPSFKSKLEQVQSLTLLQILTLFFPTLPQSLRQQAHARMPLLRNWIGILYHSVPAYLDPSMPPYDAWVLAESCRRTLHIACKVVGVHSVLTRGCFTLTLFVEALPLEANGDLWEEPKTGGIWATEPKLVSYRELTDMWDNGEVRKPRLLQEMLIAACKGIENVRSVASCTRGGSNQS